MSTKLKKYIQKLSVQPKLSAENTPREGQADISIQDYRDTKGLHLLREAGLGPG